MLETVVPELLWTSPSEVQSRAHNLSRTMVKTICEYNLIKAGDQILVAVSGGKDSYTLLDLLWQARKKAPFKFDIIGVHLDQKQPGYSGEPLAQWLADSGIPHKIVGEDTYSIVLDKTKSGGTYCSMCSRLRRGILYRWAEKLGCNKIALGHHRDDSLETLLLNLFYAGKIQAMPAMYRTDDGKFDVIRPLIECAERDIAAHAQLEKYPILPCNLCGSQSGLKREAMKDLLNNLEEKSPHLRSVMLHALKNIKPTHLLDKNLLEMANERGLEAK